jgi:hypothetical protein
LVAGVCLAFVAVIFEAQEMPGLHHATGFLAMALITGGGFLIMAGGIARPVQRLALLNGFPSGRFRGFVLRQPLLRHWYWVDSTGQRRDD